MINELKKAKMFEGLDEKILKKINSFTTKENFPSNTVIVEEDGEDDYDLFIVLKGRVKIYVSSKFFADDIEENKDIFTVNPGDNFGELSCILKKRRSASAITVGDCEILRICGKKFTALLESDNCIGYAILRKLYESLYDRIQNSNFMLRNYLI